MGTFRFFYKSDPDDETVCTFYGLLALVPSLIKQALGKGGDGIEDMADRAAQQATIAARIDGIDDEEEE